MVQIWYKRKASTDITPEQIEQAKILASASNMRIDFQAVPTEQLDFTGETFDVITACQCFWYFDHEEYDLMVPFTKESWHGRMRACRGVGASLSETELAGWDKEHRELLDRIAPEQFGVLHYAASAVLRKREK